MATPGRGVRSTRKLRQWTVEQVESGKFPGLVWDDPPAKTMFRIPWKHAGKQEYRPEEDASFFKAWAIFKGKYREGEHVDPATWKTRVRCALSKSPEFKEVPERSRLSIAEPYKVYRLVPLEEQRAGKPVQARKSKKVKLEHVTVSLELEIESPSLQVAQMPASVCVLKMEGDSGLEAGDSHGVAPSTYQAVEGSPQPGEPAPDLNEITLHLKPETSSVVTPMKTGTADFSIRLSVFYNGGEQVYSVCLPEGDCLITSVAASPGAPTNSMRRVVLPAPDSVQDPCKREAIKLLLKDLEKGLMAASNPEGIFLQCRSEASIYCQGPKSPGAQEPPGKLKTNGFLQVFSTKAFKKALDQQCHPEHLVILSVGEELGGNDSKLILIQMEQIFARRLLSLSAPPATEAAPVLMVTSLHPYISA